jgi:hypothetical protein
VVRYIVRQHTMKARRVHHDHVIEALASNRPDDAFHVGVLPRRSRCCSYFLDVHSFEDVRKDRIAIVQEISGRLVLRKGISQLLCRPGRGRMRGDRHVDNSAAVVRQNDQCEQEAVRDGGYDEQVGGHDLARVIGEKRPPGL